MTIPLILEKEELTSPTVEKEKNTVLRKKRRMARSTRVKRRAKSCTT